MADKDKLGKEKIEHSGLFDFPAIYSFSHNWWRDAGYGINEDKYSEKIAGTSRDITVEWKGTKDISDYFKAEMKIKLEAKKLTDVEVEIDGEKKKMNKGTLSIDVSPTLIKDKDGKWESSPFNRFLRDVYNKYVIPARIKDTAENVQSDTVNYKEQIKAFLELTASR